MLVINFFGAPGAGKSTAALGLSYYLKMRWVPTEYVPEFAKDLVWRESAHLLKHQLYVFAEQQMRIDCLVGKVDAVVADSPLLLSSFYSPEDYPLPFKLAVFEFFDAYKNLNFFIKRSHEYVAPGRIQDEVQSDRLSVLMERFLYETGIPYYTITASDANPRYLLHWLIENGFVKSPNPSALGQEYTPPPSWERPVLHVRLGENGLPRRTVNAIARHYLDDDIPTAGGLPHPSAHHVHPSSRAASGQPEAVPVQSGPSGPVQVAPTAPANGAGPPPAASVSDAARAAVEQSEHPPTTPAGHSATGLKRWGKHASAGDSTDA